MLEGELRKSQEDWVASDVTEGSFCPVVWVLHDLMQLMSECHDQPVRQLEPAIRRIILEQESADIHGDNVVDALSRAHMERHVNTVIDVLERIRQQAMLNGQWSDAPVTPLMFG
jgi:hypothetical protein